MHLPCSCLLGPQTSHLSWPIKAALTCWFSAFSTVLVFAVSVSLLVLSPLLPVLHACLIGYTLLQGQAIHLQEVFHVLNLSGDSLFPESLQLSLVSGSRRWLIQPLVRVVAVDPAPDALTVWHRQHLAAATAAALPNTATWRCRFGDLQVFRRTVTGLASARRPPWTTGVPSRKHAPPLPSFSSTLWCRDGSCSEE